MTHSPIDSSEFSDALTLDVEDDMCESEPEVELESHSVASSSDRSEPRALTVILYLATIIKVSPSPLLTLLSFR